MGTNNILSVNGLSKYYGRNVALDDVSLEVARNSITGLLGPNGAGKTTLVKSILGLVNYSKGEIVLNGLSANKVESRNNVAYLPEKFNFYSFYRIQDTLNFFAELYQIPKETFKEKMEIVLEQLQLTSLRFNKMTKISKGQMQRVGLAALLISDKEFLIFDEPFSGLDPIGIKEIKESLKVLGAQGKTILLCSHILSEVEQICDNYIILDKAKVRFAGTKEELKGDSLENVFYQLVKGEEK